MKKKITAKSKTIKMAQTEERIYETEDRTLKLYSQKRTTTKKNQKE